VDAPVGILVFQPRFQVVLGFVIVPVKEVVHGQVELQTAADPAIRVKVAQKLVTLSDEQLRVMTSLSRRVAVEGGRPADGLALFLIIAMLILS